MFISILSGLGSVIASFFKTFIFILLPFMILIGIMIFNFFCFHFYHFFKGYRVKAAEFKQEKRRSILKRLLVDFPKQFSLDIYGRVPHEFKEHGLHMICGEQGAGKTITVCHLLQTWKNKYPKMMIRTNMGYKYEDDSITHWKDMVKNENGVFGQVEVLDEIQTWFNSLQSKDFPIEMITEISQQRKQRKCLVGTAQVWTRIAKPIREQTTFVYMPYTVFGCLTVVRVTKPRYWDEEKQTFKRYIKTYFYVHSSKIRDSFDTYKKIEKYSNEGMSPRVLDGGQVVNYNIKLTK